MRKPTTTIANCVQRIAQIADGYGSICKDRNPTLPSPIPERSTQPAMGRMVVDPAVPNH